MRNVLLKFRYTVMREDGIVITSMGSGARYTGFEF